MSDRIRPKQFHDAAGVEDWRVLGEGACAYFRTGTIAKGVAFATAIADLPGATAEPPALDLRREGVTVRLVTLTDDHFGLREIHVEMARRISEIARTQGLEADPSAPQTVQVTIDALNMPDVVAFWRAVLGYQDRAGSDEDLIDPIGRGAPFWFQQMEEPRTQRNRIHIDLWVPHDQAEARIAAALAAGGRLVSDDHAPSWWTLADPEGNEVDIGTTAG